MKACILTIGTRGDVQPYIALGMGLHAYGHQVKIATLAEFKELVESYRLQHDTLRGDFLQAALTANGRPTPGRRGNPLQLIRKYVEMARETLEDEWASAQGAEIFIYNPAAFGGFHIAEKLGVPAFSAFPSPLYSPTKAFPSPFFPFRDLGPFNRLSHQLFAKIGPALYRRPILEWRENSLGLPPAQGENMLHGKPATKLYAYSEAVVSRPADWDVSSIPTGYWFLDAPQGWEPDPALVSFLQEGPPPVYIGFGSMFMSGGVQKTEIVLQALKLTGQRGVLAIGWGGLAGDDFPDGIFVVKEVPHDWLLPQVSVVVHHGGAGTTGAALRAGKPMVVCPFVGDQFFWGRRAAFLGVAPPAIPQRQLTAERLAEAIGRARVDESILQRAALLGEVIRAEDGVGRAISIIHGQL